MHRFTVIFEDGPVDMDRIARSGQMFRWRVVDGGWEILDGDHHFRVRSSGPASFEVEGNQPEEVFRRLFRLEVRHDETIERILAIGPELEPFCRDRVGLRLMRPHSRAETLFSFLCSANNHVSRITSMVWKLASYGGAGFPSVARIASVTEQELRETGFGYRGATIPRVAATLAGRGGEAFLDELASAGFSVARQELLALPGVGRKLADCICLFALDYGESVPIDTHIWQVMTRLYYPQWAGTSLTESRYETAAGDFRDRFGELAGAAHQFLFVDNMERYRDRKAPLSS
ncbi:MAG: hypothetical protein JST12_20780 [Armatimonadetes bacterium]|nr:hypothetical protein [Armatimonadota bacterium]